MKATIRGSRYDTDAATMLGRRRTRGRLSWLDEALYRTPRGKYFMAGRGGPDSPYGCWLATGERVDGAAIHGVSTDVAQKWLEDFCKIRHR